MVEFQLFRAASTPTRGVSQTSHPMDRFLHSHPSHLPHQLADSHGDSQAYRMCAGHSTIEKIFALPIPSSSKKIPNLRRRRSTFVR